MQVPINPEKIFSFIKNNKIRKFLSYFLMIFLILVGTAYFIIRNLSRETIESLVGLPL